MNKTLKEIRRLVKPIGDVEIRRTTFTLCVGDDRPTFNRTQGEMDHALEIVQHDVKASTRATENR